MHYHIHNPDLINTDNIFVKINAIMSEYKKTKKLISTIATNKLYEKGIDVKKATVWTLKEGMKKLVVFYKTVANDVGILNISLEEFKKMKNNYKYSDGTWNKV